jgi:hypothetical protein
MLYSIHVIYDKKYRLWFACTFIGEENHGSIAFAKTECEAKRQAKLIHPDLPIY